MSPGEAVRRPDQAVPSEAPTDDIFLGGALNILQPRDGLRAGLDAVMLAAAVPAQTGQTVLDAGAGVGIVGLCVARRCPGTRVTLIEREVRLAQLAEANIARNALRDRATVVCADLGAPMAALRQLGLEPGSFDHVAANPPFHHDSDVRVSPQGLKAAASAFAAGDLDRWLRFLAAMARPGGILTLIHRAEALGAVLSALGNRFGDARIFPLFPRAGQPASRILVQATKGSRGPSSLLPGLVLHAADGRFLPVPDAILRGGAALGLDRSS